MINQILRYKQDRDHKSLLIRKQGLYRVFVNFSSIYGKQLFIKLIFYQLVRFDHQKEKKTVPSVSRLHFRSKPGKIKMKTKR